MDEKLVKIVEWIRSAAPIEALDQRYLILPPLLLALTLIVILVRLAKRLKHERPHLLARGHLIEVHLRWWERLRVKYHAWRWWRSDGNALPALSRISGRRRLLHAENHVVLSGLCWPRPTFDSVILRQVFQVKPPFWKNRRLELPRSRRKSIRSRLTESPEVVDVMKRLICILGQVGYLPLIHSHIGGKPSYVFNAKGAEETRHPQLEDFPHRLSLRPTTIMPHYPYGHTVDGLVAGQRDGTVSPDVVAFIMMDANAARRNLGPRLYFRSRIADALGTTMMGRLTQKDFQITSAKPSGDVAYGAIDGIELFGVSGTGVEFMKFDYLRLEPSSRTPHVDHARGAIMSLRQALDDRSLAPLVDLQPGDVLLVNNWRTATAWDDEGFSHASRGFNQQLRSGRIEHMHRGDRIVFQMNFYLPKEQFAPPQPGYGTDPGAGHGDHGADH